MLLPKVIFVLVI